MSGGGGRRGGRRGLSLLRGTDSRTGTVEFSIYRLLFFILQ